ncbi:substrate-binding domain-containing protein [Rhodococcus sp. IEGM 1409]|uniref:substrate-binding domain-containing protein n=1 Tax=Rhodococcus sp. IEGM 1409 TaxID=3047082 RepID=UPI0024B75C48|nr:substrate-binding domain-containing protein [Rhodococcus sp. IEGM 1409]MDI9902489.1 substrate-binding domain-containing protein [Rhodococcus sp. IEGM 1409]
MKLESCAAPSHRCTDAEAGTRHHGTTRAAYDLGLSIPGSVLIAQDSDEPALLISDPTITALHFFPQEQAALAVNALLTLIDGDEPAAQSHARSEVRVRASTPISLTP